MRVVCLGSCAVRPTQSPITPLAVGTHLKGLGLAAAAAASSKLMVDTSVCFGCITYYTTPYTVLCCCGGNRRLFLPRLHHALAHDDAAGAHAYMCLPISRIVRPVPCVYLHVWQR